MYTKFEYILQLLFIYTCACVRAGVKTPQSLPIPIIIKLVCLSLSLVKTLHISWTSIHSYVPPPETHLSYSAKGCWASQQFDLNPHDWFFSNANLHDVNNYTGVLFGAQPYWLLQSNGTGELNLQRCVWRKCLKAKPHTTPKKSAQKQIGVLPHRVWTRENFPYHSIGRNVSLFLGPRGSPTGGLNSTQYHFFNGSLISKNTEYFTFLFFIFYYFKRSQGEAMLWSLSPEHGTSSDPGWRRRHPDMDGRCEYIE
jgi:hypothetical protein